MNVYEIITNRIIEDIQKDNLLPWQRPWKHCADGIGPMNLISRKPYRGINAFLLGASSYVSPYWLTFNQAKSKGGTVRKGERSTPVVFWKTGERENRTTGKKEKSFILRYYSVFNVAQCDGITAPIVDTSEAPIVPTLESCERLIKLYKTIPRIDVGGDRAFYSPSFDHIGIPSKESFRSVEEYYSTLLHEMVHSTGHSSRLNRDGVTNPVVFASHAYSFEELIAECGATFLCATAGIVDRTYDNSASYLKSWVSRLKEDPKWIVDAASKASKAADYIQGITRDYN